MKILVKAIEANAVNRPKGYVKDVLSKGVVMGEWLEIDQHAYNELLNKYRVKMRGIGDLVEKVARPIAHAIDAVSGGKTHVSGCNGCKGRQEWLNDKIPFK
jgi:hypothetical protein